MWAKLAKCLEKFSTGVPPCNAVAGCSARDYLDSRRFDGLLSPGLVSRAASVYLEDSWLSAGHDSSF